MRLVVARCSVDYAGQLEGSPATCLASSWSRPTAASIRRRRLQAAQLDERAPNTVSEAIDDRGQTVWTVRSPKGETLTITLHEVVSDTSHDLGTDPGLWKDGVESLQELLAANCGAIAPGLRLVRREYPTDIGPVDLLCRDADGNAVAIEIKRRGRDRRGRAAGPLRRVPRARPAAATGARRVRRPADQAAGTGVEPARHRTWRSTTTCCRESSPTPCASSSGPVGVEADRAGVEHHPAVGPHGLEQRLFRALAPHPDGERLAREHRAGEAAAHGTGAWVAPTQGVQQGLAR